MDCFARLQEFHVQIGLKDLCTITNKKNRHEKQENNLSIHFG
jgi:hypothetical protein